MVAAIFSVLMLVLFVTSWNLAASVSFLALFFASWQYINCVSFTRIALALKMAQIENARTDCRDAEMSLHTSTNPLAPSVCRIDQLKSRVSIEEDWDHLLDGVAISPGLGSPIHPGAAVIDEDEPMVDQDGKQVVDPPYSVAIVTIIAINAVMQIVLQATTFSGLNLTLQTACWVFVLVFCGATGAYITSIIALFGIHKVRFELWKLMCECR